MHKLPGQLPLWHSLFPQIGPLLRNTQSLGSHFDTVLTRLQRSAAWPSPLTSGRCPSPHQLAGMSLPDSGLLVAGKLSGCGDKLTKPLVLTSHRPPPTHRAQLLPCSFPSPLGSGDSLSQFLPHICDRNRERSHAWSLCFELGPV